MPSEQDLIDAVEQVIRHTQKGDSPSDAVFKVASDLDYGPAMVARMVEAFNKSKSVYIFKTASADTRKQTFALADTSEVISRMYPSPKAPEKQKKASGTLPDTDFSAIDFPAYEPPAETTAGTSATGFKVDARTDTFRKYYQHKEACDRLESALYNDHMNAKREFDRTLETCVSHMSQVSPNKFQKIARCVLNGYPDTGKALVQILAKRTRRNVEGLEKTANAAVFPAQEPYISITRLYDSADKLIRAETALNQFRQKKADTGTLLSELLGKAKAETMTAGGSLDAERLGEILSSPFRQRVKGIEESFDPEFYNRRSALKTRKAFVDLLLFDKDISKYDDMDVIQAYNDAVTSVPGIEKRPNMLRNMVLRNLQTGGVQDVFELKTQSEIGKVLSETDARESAAKELALQGIESRRSRGEDYVSKGVTAHSAIEQFLPSEKDIREGLSKVFEKREKKRYEATKASAAALKAEEAAAKKAREDLRDRVVQWSRAGKQGANYQALKDYYQDPSVGPVLSPTAQRGTWSETVDDVFARNLAEKFLRIRETGTEILNDEEFRIYNEIMYPHTPTGGSKKKKGTP